MANRIAQALQLKNGGNQSELARYVGVSPQAVQKWIAGDSEPKGKNLRKVAEFVGISESVLRFGGPSATEMIRPEPSSNVIGIQSKKSKENSVAITQYKEIGGSMGGGVILRDQPGEIQAWNVTPEWVHKNIKNHTGIKNLCIVTGFGNSMQPLFNPGDPLIVDTGIKVVDADATYFFRVGNEGFIKILQRIPGEGIRVISKNKDYETWTIKPDMDFEVFGQVLKAWCGTDV